ncbi:MAG: flavodoxin family protein [Treponema sp.]|jgi:multimeric flavodoxin WrbA|nr:flavodoxin family protein [Treponema sp.]
MYIIGFTGSPRKQGNTAWVVDAILDGAKKQGAETHSWYFSDMDIKPCLSCYGCRKGDLAGERTRCIIKDDMQNVYDALERADALILGAPVYMGQMSAQAKIFMDRLFGCAQFQPRFHPGFKEKDVPKKKLVLVWTQGNPDSDKFQVYYDYTKTMFQMLEFDVQDVVVVAGMRSGPAHERKDLPPALHDVGASLVSEHR